MSDSTKFYPETGKDITTKTTKITFFDDDKSYSVQTDQEYKQSDRGTNVYTLVGNSKANFSPSLIDKYTCGLTRYEETKITVPYNKIYDNDNCDVVCACNSKAFDDEIKNCEIFYKCPARTTDINQNIKEINKIDESVLTKEEVKDSLKGDYTLLDKRSDNLYVSYNNCCVSDITDKCWAFNQTTPIGKNTDCAASDILKNRLNSYRQSGVGRLYVEPFYNCANKFQPFAIPFEFNPVISEGEMTAEYAAEKLLGKMMSIRSYISSDSGGYSLETKYMALAPDNETNNADDDASCLSNDARRYGTYCQWTCNNIVNSWMQDWTNHKIEIIEKQYRSLVLPVNNTCCYLRPPVVSIIMRAGDICSATLNNPDTEWTGMGETILNPYSTIGDLYKYPQYATETGDIVASKINPYNLVTKLVDGAYSNVYKRFVVTSVKISPLESYNQSFTIPSCYYGTCSYRRNGFTVSLSLSETTKNFLDIVPDYESYYCSWNQRLDLSSSQGNISVNPSREESRIEDQVIVEFRTCVKDFWNKIFNVPNASGS